jgi:hypothetical protein
VVAFTWHQHFLEEINMNTIECLTSHYKDNPKGFSEMEGLAIMLLGVHSSNERVKSRFSYLVMVGIGRVIYLSQNEAEKDAVILHIRRFLIDHDQRMVDMLCREVEDFIANSLEWWLENQTTFGFLKN